MTKTPKVPISGTPPENVELREVPTLAGRTLAGLGLAGLISVPFAVLTVLVRTESESLERLDTGVADGLNSAVGDQPIIVDVLTLISSLSAPWVLRGVALFVAVWLWRRNDRLGAVWLGVTMAVGGILGLVLKLLVERARPEFDEPVAIASGYSFPSGHALNSMLFAACLVLLAYTYTRTGAETGTVGARPDARGRGRRRRVLAWTVALTFVVVVGLDRIALGVHYISDVAAGWVVALATVCATTLAFGVTRRRRLDTSSAGKPTAMVPRSDAGGVTPHAGQRMAATAAVHRVDVAAAGEPAAGATAATRHAEDAATWPRTIGHLAVRLVPGWIAVWALIVGLGLVLTGPARGHWPLSVEDDVSQGLEVARTSLWDSITFGLGWLGATAPVVGCALVSAVVLRRTLRRWAEPVFVLAAPLGQSVVFFFTQLLIERERPDVERLDDSPPTSSFPSGHSSAAMALWWALALICHRVIKPRPLRTAAVLFFALLPLGVVAARLYRGMHHPSDIAASLVNASLILLLTDRVVRGTAFPAVDVRTESAQDTPENGPASGPTRASGNRPADDPSRRPSIASSGGSLGEPEGGSLGEPEGGSLDRAVGEPLGGRARADGAEEVLG